MRKTFLVIWIFLVITGAAFAQLKKGQIDFSKVPVPRSHYQPEYTYDVPTDTVSWIKQKSGLHVAFGSTDELYLRSEVPSLGQESLMWKETGWRGERLNAQVLVWSPDTLEQIRFRISDLISTWGKILSKDNIKLNMVRYILSNFPYGATNFDCDTQTDSSWLMPDRFESFERFDLAGRSLRPVWISLEIPRTSEPGDYNGTIEINSMKSRVTLQVNITVQKQVLPDPCDWKFRLDLWQNPWVIAWYYHVEPWSAEHKALLKKHLKLYADAGGKYITTYAVHSPWTDASYMIEETMIDWIKTASGSWKFNYSIFDQYVELATEVGISEAITIYTPLPWGNRFRYMDEKSGNYVYENWSPTSAQFKTFWNLFLDDLKAHLINKGWFKKTYLGINENVLEFTIATARMIKENSKDWKITYAGNWHQELSPLLDDYCTKITEGPNPEELQERSAKKFTTTFYVCCNPSQPNNFVFSTPAEGRYIGWYALAFGYKGFLRWAYDAWPADPVRDARHTLFPAGDCFLVYPGGNSSIRFEKLREGIVDYEKILILRELASGSNDKNVKNSIKDLKAHLATFVVERDNNNRPYYNAAKMREAVQKGNIMIRNLSNELGY
jgi:hypothetical protein